MKLLPIVAKVARMKIPKSRLKPPPGFVLPNIREFKADIQRLGEDIAEEFKEEVIDNIERNKFGYNNAPATILKKKSDTPLIDTHEMVDAIYREETTVSVDDTPRSDSPLSNLELAIVQEYGTKDKGIPARPVWRNTFEEFRETAHKRVEEFLETHKFPKK